MENVPKELFQLSGYKVAFKLDEIYRDWKIGLLPTYIPHIMPNVKAYISHRLIPVDIFKTPRFEQIVKSCPKK